MSWNSMPLNIDTTLTWMSLFDFYFQFFIYRNWISVLVPCGYQIHFSKPCAQVGIVKHVSLQTVYICLTILSSLLIYHQHQFHIIFQQHQCSCSYIDDTFYTYNMLVCHNSKMHARLSCWLLMFLRLHFGKYFVDIGIMHNYRHCQFQLYIQFKYK